MNKFSSEFLIMAIIVILTAIIANLTQSAILAFTSLALSLSTAIMAIVFKMPIYTPTTNSSVKIIYADDKYCIGTSETSFLSYGLIDNGEITDLISIKHDKTVEIIYGDNKNLPSIQTVLNEVIGTVKDLSSEEAQRILIEYIHKIQATFASIEEAETMLNGNDDLLFTVAMNDSCVIGMRKDKKFINIKGEIPEFLQEPLKELENELQDVDLENANLEDVINKFLNDLQTKLDTQPDTDSDMESKSNMDTIDSNAETAFLEPTLLCKDDGYWIGYNDTYVFLYGVKTLLENGETLQIVIGITAENRVAEIILYDENNPISIEVAEAIIDRLKDIQKYDSITDEDLRDMLMKYFAKIHSIANPIIKKAMMEE